MHLQQFSSPLLRCCVGRNLHAFSTAASAISEYPAGWDAALPFEKIPGPTKLQYIRAFLPGGDLHNADPVRMQHHLRDRYGPLCRLPGVLGKREMVFAFEPNSFEHVYRTEGVWPMRRNLDILGYYRNLRPELFKSGMYGLISDQGAAWHKMRSTVSPVVMSPKVVKSYLPVIDQLTSEFVRRVGELRDSNGEMPADFYNELGLWAVETTGWIALDRRLDVMRSDRSAEADQLINAIREFFELALHLETKPSMWRYYKTRNLKKVTECLDVITSRIANYIDQAISESETKQKSDSDSAEISLVQRLLQKDRDFAFLTTMDMIFAGIDTISSSSAILLYRLAINPEQQEKLRAEVRRLLPNSESTINNDNIEQFTYFRACLKESMRLQPQVPANSRTTGANIILDGYRIPKETDIMMANNILQTSDDYCTRSDEFLPERWLRNDADFAAEAKSRHPFAFMPFGFGPRACIGKRYAEMQIQILTARILREYRLEWHHGPMKYLNSLVIAPASDLKLRMVPL